MVTSFVGSSAHPRHARAIVAHDQADVDLGVRLDTRLEVQRHLAGDRKAATDNPEASPAASQSAEKAARASDLPGEEAWSSRPR
jgi:hypothetical protein